MSTTKFIDDEYMVNIMSSNCINCNRKIPKGDEFCHDCLNDLDEMVDAKELEKTNQKVDMTSNVNPFFSSSSPTGSISDGEDTVGGKIDRQDRKKGTSGFWLVILLLTIVIFAMINFYLGLPSFS